jgi:putative ABC transport system permease protein|tara:strand:- start:1210 stop:2379 length:1170 start_codon:yes stop_codon:yes gene_type:complete
MKYWMLISAALKRKQTRTVLTICSITVAFVLFGTLRSVAVAFTEDVDFSGDNRLIVMSKLSFIEPLPLAYHQRIQSVEGVDLVVHRQWFGGTYIDVNNDFPKWPVSAEAWFDAYPEFIISEQEKRDFANTRTGMVAGKAIAEKYNWKVGDKIPVMGDIWLKEDGSILWEFDLVGIFSQEEGSGVYGGDEQVFINYSYFEESRAPWGKGTVGNFIVKVKNKEDNERIAKEIDKMFANSSNETKTSTEAAFGKMFAEQIGDIGLIMNSILAAVFFTMLLVTGNTMSQAVRERTSEIAVFKALGYSDKRVLGLVLSESMFICFFGMAVGIVISFIIFIFLKEDLSGFVEGISFQPSVLSWAFATALAMALIAGLPPALGAMRLKVVDALRKD